MNGVLLALGGVRAGLAWNVYRPVSTPGIFNLPSFFMGWLVGELALHLVCFDVCLTLYLLSLSPLSALNGWGFAGLALSVVAWGGLIHQYLAGRHTKQAGEDALRLALGEDYEQTLPEDIRSAFPTQPPLRALLLPFSMRHPDVERIANLPYTRPQEGERPRKLDIYRPRNQASNLPILLQVHGGGWVVGSKNHQGLPLMNHMAARGWLCAAINYRLSPRVSLPEHLIDIQRAIVWLRENAQQYGGNPDFIAITGGSAGAHLASLAALSAETPPLHEELHNANLAVSACVSFYGVYNFVPTAHLMKHFFSRFFLEKIVFQRAWETHAERFERASPQAHISPTAPPFFVIHGDTDELTSIAEARHFAETLRQQSQAPVAYAQIPYAHHAFDVFFSLRSLYAVYSAERFLSYIHHQYRTQIEANPASPSMSTSISPPSTKQTTPSQEEIHP